MSWKLLERNGSLENYSWEFIPVPMALVIKSYDTKGPAEIETKRNFLMKDCLRKSFLLDIPFNIPAKLPLNSQEMLRMALESTSGNLNRKLISVLFDGVWNQRLNLEDPEILKNWIEKFGFDYRELSEKSGQKMARAELKNNVKRAIDRGVFGVPSFVVVEGQKTELFWGADSIDSLIKFLNGSDVLDPVKYEQYLELFSSQS